MRIVKNAVVRKNEILDMAEKLFCADGYDNTSTNDILAELSIARGTLYYHFKSKKRGTDLVNYFCVNFRVSLPKNAFNW